MPEPARTVPTTALELFGQVRDLILTDFPDLPDRLVAEDLVVELPFAPPGRPRRIRGRAEFLAVTGPERAAFPARLEVVGDVTVHETTDPEVIVLEYELGGTPPGGGALVSAPFAALLQVRDGRIARWREYQDTLAIAAALGRLPGLLAAAANAAGGAAASGTTPAGVAGGSGGAGTAPGQPAVRPGTTSPDS